MKPAVKHTLRLGLTALILVMLVLFARKVNWHATWAGISSASRSVLLAAALLNIASIVVKAVRWWVFLRPVGATSFGPSGWKIEARYWIWPRPIPSSNWPPPYIPIPRCSQLS